MHSNTHYYLLIPSQHIMRHLQTIKDSVMCPPGDSNLYFMGFIFPSVSYYSRTQGNSYRIWKKKDIGNFSVAFVYLLTHLFGTNSL